MQATSVPQSAPAKQPDSAVPAQSPARTPAAASLSTQAPETASSAGPEHDPAAAPPASEAAGDPAAAPAPGPADVLLPVALVATKPIDVRRFLARMWMRDSQGARELLDQLVVSQISLEEAERRGVRITPEKVDEGVEKAMAALEKRLVERGWTKGVEEHLKSQLGMTEEAYKREMRSETIVQLLAERCVRAFSMENERSVVRLMELDSRDKLDLVRAALAAGGDFETLAKEHGSDDYSKKGGAELTLVRAEGSSLARLAFATPPGEVGGPIEEGGRYLLCKVEKRLEPKAGPWSDIGPVIEASLITDPIDDLEYAQWKASTGKLYEVDLGPFLDLIGERKP